MITLYGLKNCDTCRKAQKALPDAQLVDVREAGVPEAVMAQAFDQFGDALLNTRSTTWRGLDAQQREGAPLALIAQYPALMKRPLIHANGQLYLGWNAQTQAALA